MGSQSEMVSASFSRLAFSGWLPVSGTFSGMPRFRASLSPDSGCFRRVLGDDSFSPRFRALLREAFIVPRFGLVLQTHAFMNSLPALPRFRLAFSGRLGHGPPEAHGPISLSLSVHVSFTTSV